MLFAMLLLLFKACCFQIGPLTISPECTIKYVKFSMQ
jgi:hypothetical protein